MKNNAESQMKQWALSLRWQPSVYARHRLNTGGRRHLRGPCHWMANIPVAFQGRKLQWYLKCSNFCLFLKAKHPTAAWGPLSLTLQGSVAVRMMSCYATALGDLLQTPAFGCHQRKKKSNISGTYVSLSDCCRLAAITEKMNSISKSIEIRTQIGNFQQSKLKVNISPSKVLGWFSVSPGLPPAGITYIYKIYVDDTHVSGVHPNATCNQMRYKEKLSLPL